MSGRIHQDVQKNSSDSDSHSNLPVRSEEDHGKLRRVITEKNVYEAEKVLVAAGYESREIIRTVGIDIPMIKQKMQCLVTEAEPRMFEQMLGTAEADFYGHQSSHADVAGKERWIL